MKIGGVQSQISENNKSVNRPLVSVVIPVYNVEKYLRECVDSVINQTYRQIEIILIDDGSTDSCGDICDKYALIDSRIKLIHQENQGLGHARNVGMVEATGKYIIFLDSDDYWELTALEELIEEAEKKDLQVIAFAAQPFCDGIDQHKGPSYNHTVQNNLVKNGAESLSFTKSHGEYYAQACLRFYRLDYLKDNGFRFDEGIIHEDESFSFLAYVHADRVECLGERYYYRRYRPGSIMMNKDPVQSAHGYRVAIDTLLHYMQDRRLSSLENKLYRGQIRGYISAIFARNEEMIEKKSNLATSSLAASSNAAHVNSIAYDAQETIRHAYRISKRLPLYCKIGAYNFEAGYSLWKIRASLGRLKRLRHR